MSFKKSIAAAGCATILLTTASVFAGGPGEFDPPQKMQHFNVYLEGMMPYASEESAYVATTVEEGPTGEYNTKLYHANSKAAFGGTVGASYIFNNKSDLRVEYTYLPGKYKEEKITFPDNGGTINSTLKKTYQAVNLDMGQYWNPVQKLELHFFAGIAYRNYKHESTGTAPSDGADYDNYSLGSGIESKFSGWGPRFGIDTRYSLFKWLNIIANASMSFPYGSLKATADSSIFIDRDTNDKTTIRTESIDKFVPELAGNIGLQFNQQFSQGLWGGLEVGYRAIHLMNSDLENTSLSSAGIGYAISGYQFLDTTFYGPYLRLSVLF